jgi:hypothetical protein
VSCLLFLHMLFSDSTGLRELCKIYRSHLDVRFRAHFTSASSTSTGWVLLLVYIVRTASARLSTPVQAPVPCKLQSTNGYGRWGKQSSQVSMRILLTTISVSQQSSLNSLLSLCPASTSSLYYRRLVPRIQVRASHPCHRCTMTYADI